MSAPLRNEHLQLALDPETPYFLDLTKAGQAGVAALDALVRSEDLEFGVRAVSLCGHVDLPSALCVIARACGSDQPALREAAATALGRQPKAPPALLAALLSDPDVRVRARALCVLAERPRRTRLRYVRLLRALRSADPDPRVRRLASAVRVLRSVGAQSEPTAHTHGAAVPSQGNSRST